MRTRSLLRFLGGILLGYLTTYAGEARATTFEQRYSAAFCQVDMYQAGDQGLDLPEWIVEFGAIEGFSCSAGCTMELYCPMFQEAVRTNASGTVSMNPMVDENVAANNVYVRVAPTTSAISASACIETWTSAECGSSSSTSGTSLQNLYISDLSKWTGDTAGSYAYIYVNLGSGSDSSDNNNEIFGYFISDE
jgi:hypothetical protein